MAIVVKQNQIQTISAGSSQGNSNINAQNILQTVVNLFTSFDNWSLSENVNLWIEGSNSYPDIYTAMLQNTDTEEYMRLWFGIVQSNNNLYSKFYLTDINQSSSYNHIYVHKNNLFRLYSPSAGIKYGAYPICNIICGVSDNTIAKELGNDLGLKLPLFELFCSLENYEPWNCNCSLPAEGGGNQTDLMHSAYCSSLSGKTIKITIISDDESSKFVFIANGNNDGYSNKLRWSAYSDEFITPANENDEYLQCFVLALGGRLRSVFRAVDGSIQFGQYDTVLDGVALPAGAASDEGIVASPLFLSSQLESAGLDVPNVDNGSGYKGQIKTDWLLVSNSQVAGTTHNQGTWLNVGGGILVPWSPDAGSPFIS